MSEQNPTIWEVKLDEIPQEYWTNTILIRLAAAMGLIDPLDPNVDDKPYPVDPDWLLEEVETRLRDWEPQGIEATVLQEAAAYLNDVKYVIYRNRETGAMTIPDIIRAAAGDEGVDAIKMLMEERPHVGFRLYTPEYMQGDDEAGHNHD